MWTHRHRAHGQTSFACYDQIWTSTDLPVTAAHVMRRTQIGGDGSDHDPACIDLDLTWTRPKSVLGEPRRSGRRLRVRAQPQGEQLLRLVMTLLDHLQRWATLDSDGVAPRPASRTVGGARLERRRASTR